MFCLGCKNDCSYEFTFDLHFVDEFKGKNEIVSLQSCFLICLQWYLILSDQIYVLGWQFITAYQLFLG